MAPKAALLGLALLAPGAALADYDPSQYPAYETCALCHGLFGQSHIAKFPNLGAQKPAYIEGQIAAFLSGQRMNDGGQMATIVTELQPEDIPFVADWFARQAPPTPYPSDDTAAGEALYADLACGTCHDLSVEEDAFTPHLTAQHPAYLIKQMTDFRTGARTSEIVPGLHPEAFDRPDADLAALATFLGATPRVTP